MQAAIKTDEKSFSLKHSEFQKILEEYRSSPANVQRFKEAEKLQPFRNKELKPEKYYKGKGR